MKGIKIQNKPFLTVAATLVVVVTVIMIYTYLDPNMIWMPKCPVKMLTGYDCPGCGSQRALHAILNGDFIGAWNFNPALIVSIPIILILVLAQFKRERFPQFYRATRHPFVPIFILVSIILWTVFRNF